MSAAEPAAGRRFEYRVRDHLRADGYWVMRSPASKSPVDLVAIKPGQVLFVQCKVNGRIGPAEWNTLMDAAETAGAIPVMAERPALRRLCFWRLIARKDGSGRRQPMEPFTIDELFTGARIMHALAPPRAKAAL
jgi:Holliday junction resolvase